MVGELKFSCKIDETLNLKSSHIFLQSLTTTVFYLEILSLLAQNFSHSLKIKKGNNTLEREKRVNETEPRHLKLLKMNVDLNLSHGMFEIFVIIRKHRLLFSSKKMEVKSEVTYFDLFDLIFSV